MVVMMIDGYWVVAWWLNYVKIPDDFLMVVMMTMVVISWVDVDGRQTNEGWHNRVCLHCPNPPPHSDLGKRASQSLIHYNHQYFAHHGLSRNEFARPVPSFRYEVSSVLLLVVLALTQYNVRIMITDQWSLGYSKKKKLNFASLS